MEYSSDSSVRIIDIEIKIWFVTRGTPIKGDTKSPRDTGARRLLFRLNENLAAGWI